MSIIDPLPINSNRYMPPGSIVISGIRLNSLTASQDLMALVTEFSVYEAIGQSFLMAELVVVDSLALTSVLPILGMETVQLTFQTAHFSYRPIALNFNVIAIEPLKQSNARTAKYVIKLGTAEYLKALSLKIATSFSMTTVQSMVQQLYTNFMAVTEKQLEASETDGQRTIVIPSMSPWVAMNFLAREAKSATYPASDFMFWETVDKFNFKTLQELMVLPVLQTYVMTEKQLPDDMALTASQEQVGLTTGLDTTSAIGTGDTRFNQALSMINATTGSKPPEFLKITNFTFNSFSNVERSFALGAFDNKLYYIDPVFRTMQTKTFDYFENYSDTKHLYTNVEGKVISETSPWAHKQGNTHVRYIISSEAANPNKQDKDNKFEFLHTRAAAGAILNHVEVDVTIPGDSDRRAGDVINLTFPEWGGTDDVKSQNNRYVSGKYLVLSVRHLFNQTTGYHTAMRCVKNSYETDAAGPSLGTTSGSTTSGSSPSPLPNPL